MPRPTRFFPGTQYGRLTAIERCSRAGYGRFNCICGATKEILISHVANGRVQSCGCLHKERAAAALTKRQTTHGQFGTKTYSAWHSMKQRCSNPNVPAYPHYGGRGIKVCPQWESFEQFLADMGECPPGLTLERKDNELGYNPDNCIWADTTAQANNKRSCVRITYAGKTQNITQWAAELNLPRHLLYHRFAAGWPAEKAFTAPSRRAPK